jgi:hypothetical protein
MDQLELERWLCDYALTPPPPAVIATALGLPAGKLADSTLLRVESRVRALRLILEVLRDTFPDDDEVRRWLWTPHDGLDGWTPRVALIQGRVELVASAAVGVWNERVCLSGAA